MQGHVEAETVFLNSFFERQSGLEHVCAGVPGRPSGSRGRLRRDPERPSGSRARLRSVPGRPSGFRARPGNAPKRLPSTPAQGSRAPKWLPSTPAQRSRAPKWLPSTPAQRFIEFLHVFSSQVAPAPRPRDLQTRQTRCRNERGFLYRYYIM